MSMRTSAKEVEGLGSAKSGTEHFWYQRMTAVANVPLILFLIWFVLAHLGSPRAEVVASVKNPLVALLLTSSFVTILWHMRLGLQMVIEDYVHSHAGKLAFQLLNIFFAVSLGLAALFAVLKMNLGA